MLRDPGEPSDLPDTSRDQFVIVGDNAIFLDAIASAIASDDVRYVIALRSAEGEARDLARTFVDLAESQTDDADAVIGGGEATVTVRGTGTGGRNTEFALAAAISLHERNLHWTIASLASDGQDGTVDAAGAIVDRHTVTRGLDLGLDARQFLDNNDSGEFFRRLGLLVSPGPTGTNVNDAYLAVRTSES